MAPSPLLSLLAAYPKPVSSLPPLDEAFVRSAVTHGLPGLVRAALRQSKFPVPPSVDQGLRTHALWVTAHVARVKAMLLRTLDAFGRVGVTAAPLKGYWLGARLYPEASDRYTSDVDVLVGPADLERAEQALVGAGLKRRAPAEEARDRAHHHHLCFDEGDTTVELHFKLSNAFGRSFEPEALLANAQKDALEGRPVWTFAPEDELLYLAVHAAQSRLLRLAWLFDLKLLCANGVDWSRFLSRAQQTQLGGPAYVALHAAHRFLAADVPDDVLSALRPPLWREVLLGSFYSERRLLSLGPRDPSWVDGAALVLSATQTRDMAAYLGQLARTSLRRRLRSLGESFLTRT